MIKAILFDFGGVITTSPFDAFGEYEREVAIPSGVIRKINSINPDTNAWAKYERNEVTRDQFISAFEEEAVALGVSLSAERVLKCLETTIRPNMVDAIKSLRTQYKLAILTNNLQQSSNDSPRDKRSPTAHLEMVIDLVDDVIESSKIGVRKPEKVFYEAACQVIGVDPAECVFLDDLGINLKPARQMGMRTIKVMSEQQALKDLYEVLRVNKCKDRN
tara:strand:+ start:5215 stop:5868 length:654 start_codon:yes stop_codon:yes gene_type:complete